MSKISSAALRAVLLTVATGLVAGCATLQPANITRSGPANPGAAETPVAPGASALRSYKDFMSAASGGNRPTKDIDAMKNMHEGMEGMQMDGMQDAPPKQPLPAEESHAH